MSRNGHPKDLQSALDNISMRADRTIAHLQRILATSSGTDSLLQTLQYTLLVLHTQLSRVRDWKLRLFILGIARKASKNLLPGESVLATVQSPTNNLDNVIAGSKAMSRMISDFRTFTRLWGLLGVYDWAKSTWYSPPEDRLIRSIVWTQVFAGVGFQWYENLAYLAGKGVLRGERFNAKKQSLWWEWSSRFWMTHVALELVRLMRVWQLEAAEADVDNAENKAEKPEATNAWRRSAASNVAWAPITAHYSWQQGMMSDQFVGLFGIVACGIKFRQVWKQTA